MACCGKLRAQWHGTSAPAAPAGSAATPPRRYSVKFEYVGRSALTATGPVSGRRYRFDQPGAILTVDPRDRPGLAAVPNLRLV